MRIAGLDVGDKTIGLAVSDPLGWTAQGIGVIRRTNLEADLQELRRLCTAHEVDQLVLGLPRNMNGTYGPRAEAVRAFGALVAERLGLPVTFWDERLTTAQAQRMLTQEADVSRARRKQVVDKLAATLILQGYLDALARRRE